MSYEGTAAVLHFCILFVLVLVPPLCVAAYIISIIIEAIVASAVPVLSVV
jgi:hypothetical protein